MTSLFISYSRRDRDCAQRLTEAFKGQNLDFWIDWEGIPPTVDWWSEVERGIEKAGVFLFLVSPDSIQSKVCKQEIDHAIKNGKRLIPVVVREVKAEEAPTVLSHLNWIFLRENDDFDTAFDKLITAIKTDYEWVRVHRDLQGKALEWDRSIRKDGSKREESFLLRGTELQLAEFQLKTNASKDPQPTGLQRDYLRESRQAVDKRKRTVTGIGIGVGIVLFILGGFGWINYGNAESNLAKAQTAEAKALTQQSLAINNANTSEAAKADAITKKALADSNAEKAEQQANIARAGELAALAVAQQNKQFDLSLLLSVEAFRKRDIVRTRSSLLESTQTYPQLFQYLNWEPGDFFHITFSPDGRTLAAISWYSSMIVLWDMDSLTLSGQPFQADASILAFSPDSKNLVIGNRDGTISLWDIKKHEPNGLPFVGHKGFIESLAFAPDGRTMVSGDSDGTIIVWDMQTRQPSGQPLAGQERTSGLKLVLSPDGRTLAAGSWDDTILLWDMETRQPSGQLLVGNDYNTESLTFSSDGKTLVVVSLDGMISIWNMETRQLMGQLLSEYKHGVDYVLALSPDNDILALGSNDGPVILWDMQTRLPSSGQPIAGYSDGVYSLAFSPDGRTLAAATVDDPIILWDMEDRPSTSEQRISVKGDIKDLAFSPDGKTLASGSIDGPVILWDVGNSTPSGLPLDAKASSLAFSPDGKTLATGSEHGSLILWDVRNRTPSSKQLAWDSVTEPVWHENGIESLTFSPDGRFLATGSSNGPIILWDMKNFRRYGDPLMNYGGNIPDLSYSPDGRILATGSENGPMFIWDMESRPPRGQALETMASSVVFSPDGKILASGFMQEPIILWNVESRQPSGQLLTGYKHGYDISLAFSPDGMTLASGSNDGPIILWDMESRQSTGQLPTPGAASLVFDPLGKNLVSVRCEKFGDHGCLESIISIWDLNPQSWMERTCQRVGRNLTQTEWQQYFPGEKYRATCPQWPLSPEPTVTPSPTP